ncbi:hypothetical protein F444_19951 [Phytophthora nicotianae P1976]|uniref:Uncharacterized protein n=1 Tax=Phytophthora nicotianae P1976 TaxID=1317066 RepID=A0A080Z642_PHYNI|nr:hypothetical protein F444_19951 [Phytophthora nicotianae P1976]
MAPFMSVCDSYMLSAVPSAHSGSLLAENGGVEIGKRKFSQRPL